MSRRDVELFDLYQRVFDEQSAKYAGRYGHAQTHAHIDALHTVIRQVRADATRVALAPHRGG